KGIAAGYNCHTLVSLPGLPNSKFIRFRCSRKGNNKEWVLAELTTDYTFEGSAGEVFTGLCMFEKYPQFIPGVTATQVLPPKMPGSTAQVRFELKIIKSFFYTLNMFSDEPLRIWWELEDSNLMKKS